LKEAAQKNEKKWIDKRAGAELPHARRDKFLKACKWGVISGACFYAASKMHIMGDYINPASEHVEFLTTTGIPINLGLIGTACGLKALISGIKAARFDHFVESRRTQAAKAQSIREAVDALLLD
jgi:hypothetical protein